MLHTWVTHRTQMLLHPFFQPIIGISGLLLLLFTIAHVCYYSPNANRLSPRRAFQWLFLLIPLLLGAAYAPKSFSDQMVAARGIQSSVKALDPGTTDIYTQRLIDSLAEADPAKPFPVDVVDLVSASGAPALIQKLENRNVELRGQLYRNSNSEFKVLRLIMYCCAADATPVGVIVHGKSPADTKNMDWVELQGTVHFVQSLGQVSPQIDLTSVQHVPTPANPYAY